MKANSPIELLVWLDGKSTTLEAIQKSIQIIHRVSNRLLVVKIEAQERTSFEKTAGIIGIYEREFPHDLRNELTEAELLFVQSWRAADSKVQKKRIGEGKDWDAFDQKVKPASKSRKPATVQLIGNNECLILSSADEEEPTTSPKRLPKEAPASSRLLHHFGPKVKVAAVPAQPKTRGIQKRASVSKIEKPTLELDETAQLGLEALRLRQTDEFQRAKQERSGVDEPWDLHWDHSHELDGDVQFAGAISGPAGGSTSARMVGSIAVGVVFVEGPTPDTAISNAEKTEVMAEVIDGLGWLGTQEPDANISWHYDVRSVDLNIHPGKGGN